MGKDIQAASAIEGHEGRARRSKIQEEIKRRRKIQVDSDLQEFML